MFRLKYSAIYSDSGDLGSVSQSWILETYIFLKISTVNT